MKYSLNHKNRNYYIYRSTRLSSGHCKMSADFTHLGGNLQGMKD
jgi:hypothetical protein